MSCGVGRRHGLDPALLWLWSSLAATAPIRHLAWEPPYGAGTALKEQKDEKKKKKTNWDPNSWGVFTTMFVTLKSVTPTFSHYHPLQFGSPVSSTEEPLLEYFPCWEEHYHF